MKVRMTLGLKRTANPIFRVSVVVAAALECQKQQSLSPDSDLEEHQAVEG